MSGVLSGSAGSIRAFLADMEGVGRGNSRLIELDVFTHGSQEQAQSWVTLYDFSGLEHSAVEKSKLWRVP